MGRTENCEVMNDSMPSPSQRIAEFVHERRQFDCQRIHAAPSIEGQQVNHSACGAYKSLRSFSAQAGESGCGVAPQPVLER